MIELLRYTQNTTMVRYQPWTLSECRDVVRRELMDTNTRWWTNQELDFYIDSWQNQLQQEHEFVWGTSTVVTSTSTITLSSLTPEMERLDAIYFGTGSSRGYRLAGRSVQDLDVLMFDWRNADADTPRLVVQFDSQSMTLWPPLTTTGTLVFEYPRKLSFDGDDSYVSLPVWTQWSLKPFVCSKAYLRPGPNGDLSKALKYRAKFDTSHSKIKHLWSNFMPERFRKFKPASAYEFDILRPPPAMFTGQNSTPTPDRFVDIIPNGDVNGVNTVFTLTLVPTSIQVYKNGQLMEPNGVDYTQSSTTVTFVSPPNIGDLIIVWIFIQGA